MYPTCASYEGADEVRTEGEESQGSASSTETGEGQTTMTANDEDNHYNVREDKVQALEDQMVDRRVDLGGETFKSQADTGAWLAMNAKDVGAYIHFVDAHSLLNLGSTGGGSTDSTDILAFQSSAVKSGFSTSEEALITTSFKFELPAFFGGKDSASNRASADTRVLSAIKTYEEWDPQDGYNGANSLS